MPSRQLHKLTAKEAESLSTPGRHSDGGGLYLTIGEGDDDTRRAWVFMYRDRTTGRRKELGLGAAKAAKRAGLSLADARKEAGRLRDQLDEGKDPAKERAKLRTIAASGSTFGEFADALLVAITPGFKHRKSVKDWKRDIEQRCAAIRPKHVNDIGTDDVLEVLAPIWTKLPRTAGELRGRIERVLDAAKAKGLRSGENPARWRGHLKELLPRRKKSKRHHKAAPYKDVGQIVKALHAKHAAADTVVNRAAEFVILTAVRTSMSRFMRVREIDFKAALWTIPEERMKGDDEHEVPLSSRAVAILKAVVSKDAKPDDYVFKGLRPGQPLGENAVLHALQAVYPETTTHGFRSTFRDWAGDMTTFPREIAEMALAHKVGDEVEQAYRRKTALEKRRKMMEAWCRYIEGGSRNNVVALRA